MIMLLLDKMTKLLQGMMFPSACVVASLDDNVGRNSHPDDDDDDSSSSNDTNTNSDISSDDKEEEKETDNDDNDDNNNDNNDNDNDNNDNDNNDNDNNDNDNNNNNNDNDNNDNNNLIWYFSYGSNMNPNVFEKKRQIKPKQTRVCYVPDYVLTFGEGALPYIEPAFCTCIRRSELDTLLARNNANNNNANNKDNKDNKEQQRERERQRQQRERRRPDIHGVAFLITKREYDHVLMTEGGWGWQEYRNSYIWNVGHYGHEEVNCIEIEIEIEATTTSVEEESSSDTSTCIAGIAGIAGADDSRKSFKAYTLTGIMGDGRKRYDCNSSKRYYDIVTDGAKTSGLPISYQEYIRINHPPFQLFQLPTTKSKSKSFGFGGAITIARYILLIFSMPSILMEIGSLTICIKWNNYINDNNNNKSGVNASPYSIRRPPWIICKISYLYRYIVLETILSIIIEDIFNIPNGFKNVKNAVVDDVDVDVDVDVDDLVAATKKVD